MSYDMLGKVVSMIVTASSDCLGALVDLLEKLGSPEGSMWLTAFKKFLRKGNPWAPKLLRQLTLAIGGLSKDELLTKLADAKVAMTDWAHKMISRPEFAVSFSHHEVRFGWSTIRDLGFMVKPTKKEVLAQVKNVGILCRAEDAPYLRMADMDQPCGSWYWVAMQPIAIFADSPHVFSVGCDGDDSRYLHTNCVDPDGRWDLGDVIVFRIRD
jgi:hypothetical protein